MAIPFPNPAVRIRIPEPCYLLRIYNPLLEQDILSIIRVNLEKEISACYDLEVEADRITLKSGDTSDLLHSICHFDFRVTAITRLSGFDTDDTPPIDMLADKTQIYEFLAGRYPVDNLKPEGEIMYDFLDNMVEIISVQNENLALAVATNFGLYARARTLIEAGATNLNHCLFNAAEIGSMPLVQLLLDHHVTKLDNGLRGAARGGHLELMNFFIERGASDYESALYSATCGGHLPAINRIHEFCQDMDLAARGAAAGGHMDLLNFYLEKGANLNTALKAAARFGPSQTVAHLINRGATELNRAARHAVAALHYRNVKFLLDHGANNVNEILSRAVRVGSLDLVKLAIQRGATNMTQAYYNATKCDRQHIVDYLLTQNSSPSQLNRDLYGAAKSGDPRLYISLFLGAGATDREGALLIARNSCTYAAIYALEDTIEAQNDIDDPEDLNLD